MKKKYSYSKTVGLFLKGNLGLELCNNLEGCGKVGGGRDVQEGGDICIPMANSC